MSTKSILLPGFLFLAAATAVADETHFEMVTVRDKVAVAIRDALKRGGADEIRSVSDLATLRVQDLDCRQGQMVRKAFSLCELNQENVSRRPGIRVIELKGRKAAAVIAALEDVGVKGRPRMNFQQYQAATVDCVSKLAIGPTGGTTCTLRVVRID